MNISLRYRMFRYDSRCSRYIAFGLWVTGGAWIAILAIGMPTGLGALLDVAAGLTAHTAAFGLSTLIVGLLLIRVERPVPRAMLGALAYSSVLIFMIMNVYAKFDAFASLVIAVASIIIASAAGFGISRIFDRRRPLRQRLLIVALTLGIVPLIMLLSSSLTMGETATVGVMYDAADAGDQSRVEGDLLDGDHPGLPGDYGVYRYTYGSGQDKHRADYGDQVTNVSRRVDASRYIDDWPLWRTMFWGFEPDELPLNGTVWMPQGEGPFPIVLIVHGNHTMERFSDQGYAYLGEHLASRGMIAVSIDQNFFNYSHWSGIPDDDYKLRAWHLLQHIREIGRMHRQPDSPLYGQVDMHNIALVGHSRGGQAAAMAADAKQWFADDPTLPPESEYTIQAIAALAPTDVSIDGQSPHLQDIYYLIMYGGQDADVNTLQADGQYARTTFDDPLRFKSALFIEGANHSFFNTDWGEDDLEWPAGIFLNHGNTMEREAQQSVVKLYVSGLLETALYGERRYVELFRDYRAASEWLPDTRYVSRFESGAFEPLTDFEHPGSTYAAHDGSRLEADGFAVWDVDRVTDVHGTDRGTSGAVLEWEDEAVLSIELSDSYRSDVLEEVVEDAVLTFSIMNVEHELELDLADVSPPEPEIIIELETIDGIAVDLPLAEYADIPPVMETSYTIVPILDDRLRDGKYKYNQTPVFQTIEIPLSEVQEATGLELSDIERITFRFIDGPAKVVLDDIGFVRHVFP